MLRAPQLAHGRDLRGMGGVRGVKALKNFAPITFRGQIESLK